MRKDRRQAPCRRGVLRASSDRGQERTYGRTGFEKDRDSSHPANHSCGLPRGGFGVYWASSPFHASSQPWTIRIRGARTHNLKNVSLDLPRQPAHFITGLSGSGKSSLAFDTLYAEGQRRYVSRCRPTRASSCS